MPRIYDKKILTRNQVFCGLKYILTTNSLKHTQFDLPVFQNVKCYYKKIEDRKYKFIKLKTQINKISLEVQTGFIY